MKKNCENCKHLKWIDGDSGDESGFDCIKRNDCTLTQKQESDLLYNLTRESYREKAKSCCELIERRMR